MTQPVRSVYTELITPTDPRLKRKVNHDSLSRRFAFDTSGLTIASVEHVRHTPILNQGRVGKCTAEAGAGVLGCEPYWSQAIADLFAVAFGSFDDHGTDRLYNAEENIDGDGPYPPQDNGSSGLTLAKALRAAGLISGWTQTFSLDGFLKALTQYPIAVGTYWYESMMDCGPDGMLNVNMNSGLAGGHEYVARSYDADLDLIGFDQSWGTRWGKQGRFFMKSAVFGKLLAKRGDATVFVPASQPPPTPTPVPVPDADHRLLTNLGPWMAVKHAGDNAAAVKYVQAWQKDKGL